MRNDKIIKLLLAINAVTLLPLALWPLVAPQSFYDTFPGGGLHWIDINGPYNEHFIRDFGALNAALLVVIVSRCGSRRSPCFRRQAPRLLSTPCRTRSTTSAISTCMTVPRSSSLWPRSWPKL